MFKQSFSLLFKRNNVQSVSKFSIVNFSICLSVFLLSSCDSGSKDFIPKNQGTTTYTDEDLSYIKELNSKSLIKLSNVKDKESLSSNSFPTDELKDSLAFGQLLYVPVYSEIYSIGHHRTERLSSTLSIRNVNPNAEFYITRLEYYDTEGNVLKEIKSTELPIKVNPLETKNHVVALYDDKGGVGANFILEWRSSKAIVSPMVETIMISTESNWGLSFTAESKTIEEYGR
ncbi:DUF3124 domain-containing protein [Bernardetia sp.]|uniref:DUF3124 domain-containing protein n=1 Tax=Bernardetia sp. TaxID=1937974 RepID=UPI0025BE49EC|nr:DUF3124 domain-containing protein [Bernardetia sp.]